MSFIQQDIVSFSSLGVDLKQMKSIAIIESFRNLLSICIELLLITGSFSRFDQAPMQTASRYDRSTQE